MEPVIDRIEIVSKPNPLGVCGMGDEGALEGESCTLGDGPQIHHDAVCLREAHEPDAHAHRGRLGHFQERRRLPGIAAHTDARRADVDGVVERLLTERTCRL